MNYTQKNKILLFGSLAVILVLFVFLIKPVIELNTTCSNLSKKLQVAIQASRNGTDLKNKIHNIDKLLLTQGDTGLASQQRVLETVSRFCNSNNTLLKEFPKTIITKNGDYLLETHVFTIEGAYPALLNLAYELEHQKKIGRIASLNFKTKTDMKTQRKTLLATIYLQTIKKSA